MKRQVEIEVGGQELTVHCGWTPGEDAQTSGPPEDCYEGSDAELAIEKIELLCGVPGHLSRLDITDLCSELNGETLDTIMELVMEQIQCDDEDFEEPDDDN